MTHKPPAPKSSQPITDSERTVSFLTHIGTRASLRTLAKVTRFHRNTVRRIVGRRRHVVPTFAAADLFPMHQSWLKRGKMNPRRMIHKDDNRAWTGLEQDELVREYGTRSLAEIADHLERTVCACEWELRRIGANRDWTYSRLAKAIRRHPIWVRGLIEAGILRGYFEIGGRTGGQNKWLYVHRDDAEWMVYCWDRRSLVPRHPGELNDTPAITPTPAR